MNRQTRSVQVPPQISQTSMAQNSVPQNISNIAALSAGPQQNALARQQFIQQPGQNSPNMVPGVGQLQPQIVAPGQPGLAMHLPIRHNIQFPHAYQNATPTRISYPGSRPPVPYNPGQRPQLPPQMISSNSQIPGQFPQYYPVPGQPSFYTPQFHQQQFFGQM